MSAKTIAVTGAAGFIGRYVVKRLLEMGHTVVGIDSLEKQVHHMTYEPVKHDRYAFEYRSVGTCPITYEYDAVVHLAAAVGVGQSMYEPARYVECNTLQTAQLLEKLTTHRPTRLVVASSMSVYGEGLQHVGALETWGPDLRSIYALTKYDQEQLSLIWGRAHGVPTVALRFFNTYGPGQALQNPYTGALAIFATRLLNGKAPVLYEDGQQTRDFVYVEDVAEAVVRAATTDMEAGVYNVGTGAAMRMESVALLLAHTLGVDILPVITGKHRAGDIRHCYANNAKLRATGWEPKVGIVTGMQHYVEWLRTQPLPVDRFEEAAKELEAAGLVR